MKERGEAPGMALAEAVSLHCEMSVGGRFGRFGSGQGGKSREVR